MPELDDYSHSYFETGSNNLWFTLTAGLAILGTLTLIKLDEASNRINYDSFLARKIAGLIIIMTNILHTENDGVDIVNEGSKIIVAGPHRSSLDGLSLASKVRGGRFSFLSPISLMLYPVWRLYYVCLK